MRGHHWVLLIVIVLVAWWAYKKYGKGAVAQATGA